MVKEYLAKALAEGLTPGEALEGLKARLVLEALMEVEKADIGAHPLEALVALGWR